MDNAYAQLDDAKAEVEKLRAECQLKTQLFEGLKKDGAQEFLKFQETRKLAEEQARQLDLKSEEIHELNKILEDLKSSLHKKEIHIEHLNLEGKNILANCADRLHKLEDSNRELGVTLDEVKARNDSLEQDACASSKEISGLKELLLAAEKKCSEAEEKVQQATLLKRRDDVILQLEEENISMKDKIKWRNEQFKHLEEAHEKLQVEFRLSKEEWNKERSALLEEMASLQVSLDSQTRNVDGLQSRLDMCNHALAHEESKRKLLEAEISEFKSSFENVYSQCEEKKSEIQQLTTLRNDEIAQLRNSLGKKEMVVRELERNIVQLEQDNKELGDSLKELREAQIKNGGANSLTSKLRNKLRRLEEVHKSCASILKSKESRWGDQLAKMEADVVTHKSTLTNKEQKIRELQMDLENCYYCIEENRLELLIFKSELAEAYFKSFRVEPNIVFGIEENANMVLSCTEQLGVKDNSLKSMAQTAQQLSLLDEELKQQKRKLEESSEGQLILEEQLLQMEYTLLYERSAAFEALEVLELEIASKNDEISRLDREVQDWKSTTETLKISYEEIQGTSKKVETSLLSHIENEQALKQANKNLLCIVKDQERKTKDLLLQISLLQRCNDERMKEAERCKQEKQALNRLVEEKECYIKYLQKDIAIASLKQDSMEKELKDSIHAKLNAEKALMQEKEILLKFKDEKDQTIKHFQELATASEQDLLEALSFSFSKQVEKWIEGSMLSDALKNAEYMAKLKIEEKNKRIVESEESFFNLKQEAEQLQASLEAMKFENEKLMDEQKTMECTTTELKFEKGNLLQDIMTLSTKKEDMLAYFEDIFARIGELYSGDKQLIEMLENALNTSEDENDIAMGSVVCFKSHESARDSANGLFPPPNKKTEENCYGRSPLREVNSLHI
ncbi:hypothetical protein VNO78_03621 [Psophocarpus tetragonolobus]|uniref:Uncharacterized protein n=1 Tax=Psophocarpus tetragonolobus TaxID=3891 RepID=A0AAN9XW36_PSOTE